MAFREGGRSHCIYCDKEIVHTRTSKPLYFCNVECRAKGQMNISFFGSKATETQAKYRKKRRGTTNTMELCAIWDILRNMDEPQKATWIVESLHDEFGKKRWCRVVPNGLRKKLNHFKKELIVIDRHTHALKYKGAKNVSFKEALCDKTTEWLEAEYENNTSSVLKKDN